MGRIAEEQGDLKIAEKWYLRSLEIRKKQGNELGAADTYGQLGNLALAQHAFENAEKWYLKSLVIVEKQGHELGAATTYGQLGILAGMQDHFEASGKWLIKCISTFARCNVPNAAKRNAENFMTNYANAPSEIQAKLKAMWEEAGLGALPEVEETEGAG